MKSSIRLISLLCLCLLFSSCSFLIDLNPPQDCSTLLNDESRLLSQADSYFYRTRDFSQSTTMTSLSFRSFSGLDTLYRFSCSQPCLLSVEYDVSVDSNQCKLVLVDSARQKVVTLCQGSATHRRLIYLPSGTHLLKAVGCSVSGKVTIKVEPQGDILVGF